MGGVNGTIVRQRNARLTDVSRPSTLLAASVIFLAHSTLKAQSETLRQTIARIAADAQGRVSVACALPGVTLDCHLNLRAAAPMQSVFKVPLAMAALHLVQQGKLMIDQPVRFLATDRILPGTFSSLQDRYPNADVEIPLRELLRLAVDASDNVAADIVLRVIGGPAVVDEYIKGLGIAGFHLQDNEAALHRDVQAQYRNWFEASAAVELLRQLADRSPLTPLHTQLLLQWMRDTPRGPKRLKGLLPEGVEVMHKPGTSGVHNGLAHATNDMGLIRLPDGRMLAIAVFVTDARADEATRERVIARITRAIYDAALAGRP